MNIPWLTPAIGAIADGKIAAMLQAQVELLASQRDDALSRLALSEGDNEKLRLQLSDCQNKRDTAEQLYKKLREFHKNDGPKIVVDIAEGQNETLD